MKTTKAVKKSRKAVNWKQLISLIESGMSAVAVAAKMGRTTPGKDPGHSIRALASRARTLGYKVDGKTVKLKVKRFGQVKKAKTIKKAVAIKKMVASEA
jgi:hypothetical protein